MPWRGLRFRTSLTSTAVTILALVTFALVLIRALKTADPYWDTLAYHWPYAARLAGLCDRSCFVLWPAMESRYDGFPLVLTALQGYLWRFTGTPALGDLFNIATVVILGLYLKARFEVPLAWSWLAFLAIPAVQVQLTSSYIDVPINAAVTIAVMVLLRMLVARTADHRADVLLALLALGFAAGSKYQMLPVALLAWSAIVLLATGEPALVRAQRRAAVFSLLAVAGALVLLPKVVANALHFGNPLYPVGFDVGPLHFAGTEGMMPANSISEAWKDDPRWLRWLASVFEFDAFRGRPLLWTVGQADVQQGSPSFRMGGYFVPYVLAALALVSWSARATPLARRPLGLVIVLGLLCAALPMSHELRYYMFWMLTLVSCALVLAHSPVFAHSQQSLQRSITQAAVAIAAASVISMTGAAYLLASKGEGLSALLKDTNEVTLQVPDGGTLCVLNRNPRAFLYASLFHPTRRYLTRVLFADEPADCSVRLNLDR